jgi:hypothetical protein
MFYLVAGRTLLIEVFDELTQHAVSEVFSGWFFHLVPPHIAADQNATPHIAADQIATIRIHRGPGLPTIPSDLPSFEITCGGKCFTDDSCYYLKFDDALVLFSTGMHVELWLRETLDSSSSLFVQLLSQALAPALRRCGVFEVHSAGVILPESKSAIMLAGASGSGKSTLTTQLASLGWSYLSDDILLLTEVREELHLQAFRRFFALTADTLAAVGLPNGKVTDLKHRLIPQDHFSLAPVEQSEPGAIVFPTIRKQRESQMKALTTGETMSRLLRLCPWASYDKWTSLEHLRILGRLANSANGFELLAGTDILNDPNLTVQMLFNIPGKAFSAY